VLRIEGGYIEYPPSLPQQGRFAKTQQATFHFALQPAGTPRGFAEVGYQPATLPIPILASGEVSYKMLAWRFVLHENF
jgi:hypothetical protein